MLKVVIDTSVFIAGLLTKNPQKSNPAQIITKWREGEFTLVMSPQIMKELVAKLVDLGIEDELIIELVATISKAGLHIPGAYEATRLNDIDTEDNMFLAASLESGADYLVSCDGKSLLPLKHYHGTQIRTPELFMRVLLMPTEEIKEESRKDLLEEELRELDKETFTRRGFATPRSITEGET